MSLMKVFPEILEAGRKEYEEMRAAEFSIVEEAAVQDTDASCSRSYWRNRLALGENGAFMKALLRNENMAGKMQMVYIDPPFFSKASYDAVLKVEGAGADGSSLSVKHLAYEDVWSQGIGEYLTMLASRLFLIRDLLSEEGTVWVHLDWHAVHYVRILMDEIFGEGNFVNEIIWTYKSGGSGKKHFARKHDTILVYSKTKDYYFKPLKEKSYNRGLKPYRFKGVEEFQDEIGWYTMVNMKDVWQIDMVGRTSSERTGYATQKPEALLERILECSTREGDICGDFFCGSGTLAAAAQKMNRRWLCCDQGRLAAATTWKRIAESAKTADEGAVLEQQTGGELKPWPADETRLNVRCQYITTAAADQKRCRISLEGCRTFLNAECLDGEGMSAMKKTAETNPLNLLDYWSIDLNYDGTTHRPQHYFMRRKGKLELCWEGLLRKKKPEAEEKHSVISVCATDVLGNRYQTLIAIAESNGASDILCD